MPLLTKALVQRYIAKKYIASPLIEGVNRIYEDEIVDAAKNMLNASKDQYNFTNASHLLLEFKQAIDLYAETFDSVDLMNVSENICTLIHNIIIQNNNRILLWLSYPSVDEYGFQTIYTNNYPLPIKVEQEQSNAIFINLPEIANLQNVTDINIIDVGFVPPQEYQYDNETLPTSATSKLYFSQQSPVPSRSPSPSIISTSVGSDNENMLPRNASFSLNSRSPSPPLSPEPNVGESYARILVILKKKLVEAQQIVIDWENKIKSYEKENKSFFEAPARDLAHIKWQRMIIPQTREILPRQDGLLLGIKSKNMNKAHVATKASIIKNFNLHIKKVTELTNMKNVLNHLQPMCNRLGSAYVAKLVEGAFFNKRKTNKIVESDELPAPSYKK